MLQTSQSVTELPGSDRRVSWIVGRRFLRHNLFEVAESLPDAKRKSALGLLVRKWSPFPSTGFSAQWVGNKASVYAWDAAQISSAIAAAGIDETRATVWPETFFRASHSEGAVLAAMSDGVEGQVWRRGLLVATRWWAEAPPARDWMLFLRAAGVDLSQASPAVPAATGSELLTGPWTVAATPITDVWSLVQNNQAAAIAAAVVAAPFLYFLTEAAVLSIGTWRAESAIAGMSAANQSVRTDRTAALTNLDAAESYLSLDDMPSQFELLATAADLIKGRRISISDWTFDSGNLDLVLQADRPMEAAFYIEAFERDEHFSNVTGSLANQEKELRLKMQVDHKTWPAS
ncbi:MAG: hypothetical protein K1X51_00950 [Rhodospirillaceae bacterium]|nr:hypothetical protein [Rhodospirillaceae bacterium]